MSAHPPATSAVAGVGLVTAGALTANVAAYLLHVPASRWLGLGGYSEFASLLSVQLLLAVPALALQAAPLLAQPSGAIPGVVAAGTQPELVQEGFMFTEDRSAPKTAGSISTTTARARPIASIRQARSVSRSRTPRAQTSLP